MRNNILTIIALFIFLLVLGQTVVLSQDPEVSQNTDSQSINDPKATNQSFFEEAYANYQREFELYNTAHSDYLFRKAQHARFNTLTSKQELQKATISMLTRRDDVVIAYLDAVKAKVLEDSFINEEEKDSLIVKLDSEIGWFNDHRGTIPSGESLEDLAKDSDKAKIEWEKIPVIVYESFAKLANSRILDFTKRTEESFFRLKDKIGKIRADERQEYSLSEEKLKILDRWIFETEVRIARSKEKRSQAEEIISKMPSGASREVLSSYNSTIEILGQSQLYLKEANTFMKEIIREIKTKE